MGQADSRFGESSVPLLETSGKTFKETPKDIPKEDIANVDTQTKLIETFKKVYTKLIYNIKSRDADNTMRTLASYLAAIDFELWTEVLSSDMGTDFKYSAIYAKVQVRTNT
jgi:hypothetical protein